MRLIIFLPVTISSTLRDCTMVHCILVQGHNFISSWQEVLIAAMRLYNGIVYCCTRYKMSNFLQWEKLIVVKALIFHNSTNIVVVTSRFFTILESPLCNPLFRVVRALLPFTFVSTMTPSLISLSALQIIFISHVTLGCAISSSMLTGTRTISVSGSRLSLAPR